METTGFLHEQFEQVDDTSPSVITCHSKHCRQLYRKLFTYVWDVYNIYIQDLNFKHIIYSTFHIQHMFLRSPTDISKTVSLPATTNLKKIEI